MKWIAIMFLAIGAFVLAGFVAIANPGAAGEPVEIVMTEMRFSPNRIDARVGQPVVLIIVNRGSQRHDLAFAAGEMPNLRGVEALTMPGQSTRLTMTLDTAGVYPFLCTIPGHAAAGMTGAMYVSP